MDSITTTPTVHNPSLEEELAAQTAAKNAKTPAVEPNAPAKILGKFDNQEALVSSYSELEAANTRLAQELAALKKGATPPATDPKPETPPAADPNADPEAAARQASESAGVNFDALRESYDANGALSDEDFAKLEKGGIPRHLVEEFIAGQEARATILQDTAFSVAGDEAAYGSLIEWAGGELSAAEIAAYNKEVNSGDTKRVKTAVEGLKTRFEKSEGTPPARRLEGSSNTPAAGDVFKSWEEVQLTMRSKDYKTSQGFRDQVAAKLARSQLK